MSDTDTIERVDLDVDLDKALPCEQDDCDREAIWKGTTPCCHATAVVCGPCRHLLERSVRKALADKGTEYICAYCREPLALVIWTRL